LQRQTGWGASEQKRTSAAKWRYKQDIFRTASAVRLGTRPISAIREAVPLTKADFFAIAGPRAFKTAIFPNQRFRTRL